MAEAIMAGKPCVLVVDDDPSVCETLCEVVEMIGCSAVVASNGAEALKVLEGFRPCLAIVDIMMPVMNGTELIEAMRGRAELADLAVLVSTAAPERAPAGVAVIRKPIDIGEVWAWMRRNCPCIAPAGTEAV
jgi:CheY-like chemotaxis protein